MSSLNLSYPLLPLLLELLLHPLLPLRRLRLPDPPDVPKVAPSLRAVSEADEALQDVLVHLKKGNKVL